MRGNAIVRHRLHLFGTNLNLDWHPVHAKQRGMQRLITVRFRDRNVIFETPGHRLVQTVHGAEHAVTGVCLIDHDAKCVNVHNLGKGFALNAHLLVNTVQVLLAATAAANQALALEARLY